MSNLYDGDVVACAYEQAALLRSGRLEHIDRINIADEIEAVAYSEQRELANCFALLLCDLLKCQFQPLGCTTAWRRTIRRQRTVIARWLAKMPSMRPSIDDNDWLAEAFNDAVLLASEQIGIDQFPDTCPWTISQILDPDFHPG